MSNDNETTDVETDGNHSRLPLDKDFTRRDALKAGAGAGAVALGAGAAAGGYQFFTAPTFLEEVDKNATENRAMQLRNDLDRAESRFDSINGDAPISTVIADYRGSGNELTENFRLRQVDNPDNPSVFSIEGEEGGDSFEYALLEDTELAGGSLETVQDVLDVRDDGVVDIPLTGSSERRIEREMDDFSNIALYIRKDPETSQPMLGDDQLDELEDQKELFDETVDDYRDFILNTAENSPYQVSEGATDIIYDEIGEADTSRHVTFLDTVVSGENYHPEDNFTQTEAENLIEGEGKYEEFGLEQTKERADQLIVDSAIQAGKAAVLSNALGYALQEAGRQAEIYDEGDFDRTGQPRGDDPESAMYDGCSLESHQEARIENYAEENGMALEDVEFERDSTSSGDQVLQYGADIEGGEYEQIFVDNC